MRACNMALFILRKDFNLKLKQSTKKSDKKIIEKTMKLVITQKSIDDYANFYFKIHPKAYKKPIEYPYHQSVNVWMIMSRPAMNSLKQKWKDFIIWFIENQGYSNLHIEKCEMTFTTYFKTNRRHDADNTVPKFILDGLSESGFIVDDDSKHLTKLTLQCGYDKDFPRTEIEVVIKE